ncbi:MAG: DinB family protein [Gemmatimonadetes bacterium]|nr:DinB family protein [Gemmatimonadota bacterium]
MHPQLQALTDEFGSARERLHRLQATVPAERWAERPAEGSWSVAECVAHLNLTSRAYVGPLREALARGRAEGGTAPERYRRDLLGWLIWRAVRPEARMKARTSAAFVPTAGAPAVEIAAEFDRLQDEQMELVRMADGLPLGRLKIVSPFGPRLKYNVYSALTVLPAHQHRHLQQAERAWQSISSR